MTVHNPNTMDKLQGRPPCRTRDSTCLRWSCQDALALMDLQLEVHHFQISRVFQIHSPPSRFLFFLWPGWCRNCDSVTTGLIENGTSWLPSPGLCLILKGIDILQQAMRSGGSFLLQPILRHAAARQLLLVHGFAQPKNDQKFVDLDDLEYSKDLLSIGRTLWHFWTLSQWLPS